MPYDQLAQPESVRQTVAALNEHHFTATVVPDAAAALTAIKDLIPAGASVMNGASQTLEQIGFVDYLKSGQHGWDNLHADIVAETDLAKQAALRQQAVHADYYLGSVHAVTETGELVIASNTGSQLPHLVFTSPNLILIASTKKIVPDLSEALRRISEYVVPLEDVRMQKQYGVGTQLNKIVILKGENPRLGRQVHLILVEEDLGF